MNITRPRFATPIRPRGLLILDGSTGRIIKIGLTEVHYLTEAPAREWLARYPAGAKPPVRYDPTKPEVSTLEVGQVSGCRLIFAGSIGLLLGLGGVVFTIWSALTPAG